MKGMNTIQVKGLVVEHLTTSGRFRALDCPEFTIGSGTSLAIMGPSGCGKSTLLGVLAGLATPTAGSVSIGATEITALSESRRVAFRKDTIGVVYQADKVLSLSVHDVSDFPDGRVGFFELFDKVQPILNGRKRVA